MASVRQAVSSMSIEAARANAKKPMDVARIRAARNPSERSYSLRPPAGTRDHGYLAPNADGNRAPNSFRPKSLNPSAASQYIKAGFSNQATP